MSLWADYIKEREGKGMYETEYGFATYVLMPGALYIEDIYVVPERRKDGHASLIADHLTLIAKEKGCTCLMGSVKPSARGATDSLKVLLAYGFKLFRSEVDALFFTKEI